MAVAAAAFNRSCTTHVSLFPFVVTIFVGLWTVVVAVSSKLKISCRPMIYQHLCD